MTRKVLEQLARRMQDGPPSQRQISEDFFMSERTLQRKLKAEGTTFKELTQRYRLDLARSYLSSPGKSIVETAYTLGFTEPSAFSRAFKGWTGQSPNEYRQQYL